MICFNEKKNTEINFFNYLGKTSIFLSVKNECLSDEKYKYTAA